MCFTIKKRIKPQVSMPEPKFEDNWLQERYEQNVKNGVLYLQQGKPIHIYDDGRGYELALEIKQKFILEYQKQLSEHIQITGLNPITISFKSSENYRSYHF